MLARYLTATLLILVTALLCVTPSVAQTDLKAAAISIAKDIHADSDIEKLKGAKLFIAPFLNRKAKKDDTANALLDMLSTEFINKKHFKIVEREQMDKALKELALGESGFVETSTAKKLGKFVGAAYGLIGSITEVEGTTLISVRVISVETGEAIVAAEATPGYVKGTSSVVPFSGATNPKDKAELVYIPAGEFVRGSNKGSDANEKPQRKVFLEGYWIYKYPVTVAQYRKFCEATGKVMPQAPEWGWLEDHPIVNITWDDAMDYCQWVGMTLPTEAQWEKAARGTDGRSYAWGKEFDNAKVWSSVKTKRSSTAPVHRETYESESPYGCIDMGGNVWQWCRDWYAEDYYQVSPLKNPQGAAAGDKRVLRGGSWHYNEMNFFRTTHRVGAHPSDKYDIYGFRCVSVGL